MTKPKNRRWVVVLIRRSRGEVEVYGIFSTRQAAWAEMDRRTTAAGHDYIGGKLTQIKSSTTARVREILEDDR